MRILKNPLIKLTLIALVVGLANPALAEWKRTYSSQGNNVGMQFSSSGEVCGGSHQFPKGSGNMVSAVEGMWPKIPMLTVPEADHSMGVITPWNLTICWRLCIWPANK